VTVSYSIMAHPSREKFVSLLLEQIPSASVHYDDTGDRWGNGRACIMARDKKADWHVVVQDDAVLCRDFTKQVEAALSVLDDGPVSFYIPSAAWKGSFGINAKQVIREARIKGRRWLKTNHGPSNGVCIALPTRDIPTLIRWCDHHLLARNSKSFDRRLAYYYRGVFNRTDRRCYYSIPCLVDHRVERQNIVVQRNRVNHSGRVAACFERTVEKEWNASVLEVKMTPRNMSEMDFYKYRREVLVLSDEQVRLRKERRKK
jgi:hypothetical protein